MDAAHLLYEEILSYYIFVSQFFFMPLREVFPDITHWRLGQHFVNDPIPTDLKNFLNVANFFCIYSKVTWDI